MRHRRVPARDPRAAIVVALTASLITATGVLAKSPDRIDLPAGWQPEGITTDGTSLFVGSLADGAIWRGDPATGEGAVLAPGMEGAVSVGLDADLEHGRIWATGGPTGVVRAYDTTTGKLLASYAFEGGFLNDVAVTTEAVYITDSFVPQVLVVPLGEDGTPAAPEEAFALPISGELDYGEGFNINGIVATEAGLVVVHSGSGELFRVDPETGEAARIDTAGADLTAGDGMELDGDTLYVVRNRANQVVVLQLDEGTTAAEAVRTLESQDFEVPTTAALVGDDLWAVNARFVPDPERTGEYWLTRLDTATE